MAEVEINYLQNNQPNGKDQENQYNIQGLAYQNKSAHEVEAQRGKILLKREKAAEKYEKEIENNSALPKTLLDAVYLKDCTKEAFEKIREKIQITDVCLCLLSIVIISLVLEDNKMVVNNFNILEKTFILQDLNNYYRYAIIGLSILCDILIIYRYSLMLDSHKLHTGSIANFDNLMNTKKVGPLLGELLINSLIIPPIYTEYLTLSGSLYIGLDYSKVINNQGFKIPLTSPPLIRNYTDALGNIILQNYTGSSYPADIMNFKTSDRIIAGNQMLDLIFSYSTIISFFNIIRLYHFIRLVYSYSYWTTLRANSVCKLMNTSSSVSFGLKSYLKMKPLYSLLSGVTFLTFFFGTAIYIVEYYNSNLVKIMNGYSYWSINSMIAFAEIYNSFWLVLITMTTVGYGDLYPTNYFGRVLAIISCIFGTFFLSLLVVFLNNVITFDELEKTVYNTVCEREAQRGDLKPAAYAIIKKILMYNYMLNNSSPYSKQTLLFMLVEFRYMTRDFKLFRFEEKKVEIDIEGILGSMKINLEKGITPLNNQIKDFSSKSTMCMQSFETLNNSVDLVDSYLTNSIQTWNLLAVLNNNQYLENLTSIEEVYAKNAYLTDEIVYYHKNKRLKYERKKNREKKNSKDSKDSKSSKDTKSEDESSNSSGDNDNKVNKDVIDKDKDNDKEDDKGTDNNIDKDGHNLENYYKNDYKNEDIEIKHVDTQKNEKENETNKEKKEKHDKHDEFENHHEEFYMESEEFEKKNVKPNQFKL